MDLPDVDTVVQWRATCDMCDLWQRFGRVARATGREGAGILFHEKSHLDDSREQKRITAAKRKALGDGGRPAKRVAIAAGGRTGTVVAQIPTNREQGSSAIHPDTEMEEGPVVDSRDIERKAKYNQRAIKSVPTRKAKGAKDSKPTLELYGPLDDFINAGEREEVQCRRMPVKLYFDGPIRPVGQLSSHGFNAHLVSTKLSCPRRPPPLRRNNPNWLHPLRSTLVRSLL